jgi:hypothetical protein
VRPPSPSRFEVVDVIIEAAAQPLAAWQVEVKATSGQVRIVGIEGGAPGVFAAAPFYDPAAMRGERVIIAAYSTAAATHLPRGRVRVARIHVQVTGGEEPQFQGTLHAAATAGGAEIDAAIEVNRGVNP